MPKASLMQTALNAGEWSPAMDARVDLARYGAACREMQNMIPLVQGPAVRRPGTRHVKAVKTQTKLTRLVPFQYSTTAAYICEFGDQYIRFYTGRAQLESSGSPVEVASPYLEADLDALQFVQSADVLYIVHPSYQPRKLTRVTATSFTLTAISFDRGPFQSINKTTGNKVHFSAQTGSVTITATSGAWFTSDMVGALLYVEQENYDAVEPWQGPQYVWALNEYCRSNSKIYKCASNPSAFSGNEPPSHNQGDAMDGGGNFNSTAIGVKWSFDSLFFGIVRITGFTSSTVMTGTVIQKLPTNLIGSSNASSLWALGEWYSNRAWPATVAWFQDRLVMGGSNAKPDTVWMSTTGDYENFSPYDEAGVVTADAAVSVTISDSQVNAIRWMAEDNGGLLIGTVGAEHLLEPLSANAPFSATNLRRRRMSKHGSEPHQALELGSSVAFIQRGGRKLRGAQFVLDRDKYLSNDLTVLSEHITRGGLEQSCFVSEPYSSAFFERGDGALLGLSWDEGQEVQAWHRHVLGGSGVVESVATIPSPSGDADDLWLIVRRTINGATARYVEFIDWTKWRWDGTSAQDEQFFVDSGVIYSGAATTTITGLSHLEGQTVQVFADGAPQNNKVVSGGQITLDVSASKAHVGLACPARIKLMRLEGGAAAGVSQGKTKRVQNVTARLLNSGPFKAGPSDAVLDYFEMRVGDVAEFDGPIPLFSGDKDIPWPDGYGTDADILLVCDLPVAFQVLGVMPDLQTQDK